MDKYLIGSSGDSDADAKNVKVRTSLKIDVGQNNVLYNSPPKIQQHSGKTD